MAIALMVLAVLVGTAAVLKVALQYKLEVVKVDALRDGAEYERGTRDGMERAARLLETGAGAKQSGVYTPSPATLAEMVRAANSEGSPR